MLASVLSLPVLGAWEPGTIAQPLVADQPETADIDPSARNKQIARWIYDDKVEQELDESKQLAISGRWQVTPRTPGTVGRHERKLINDPHYRHIPNWAISGHQMPDNGTFPAAMIAGQGKCGTNVLAEALYRLNFNYPLTDYSIYTEEARQGWAGEVNWPGVGGCSAYETEESLAEYKQIFSPVDGFGSNWLDKSTANLPCAREIAKAFPKDVKYFSMMCDPVMALWSRMNQVRQARGEDGSNPTELDYVLQKRLHSAFDCYTLMQTDKRLEDQQELCYQLEGGLRLLDVIGQWKEHIGSRMKFLLAEVSKQNSSYLVREAARHLGYTAELNGNLDLGEVHTNVAEATYLEPEGPHWNYFISRMRPTFRPLIMNISQRYPDDFPNLMLHWQALSWVSDISDSSATST